MNDNDLAIGYGGGLSGRPTDADIADTLYLMYVAMATIFWLSIYGVHIGTTCQIRLNRACAAVMPPYVKLL